MITALALIRQSGGDKKYIEIYFNHILINEFNNY